MWTPHDDIMDSIIEEDYSKSSSVFSCLIAPDTDNKKSFLVSEFFNALQFQLYRNPPLSTKYLMECSILLQDANCGMYNTTFDKPSGQAFNELSLDGINMCLHFEEISEAVSILDRRCSELRFAKKDPLPSYLVVLTSGDFLSRVSDLADDFRGVDRYSDIRLVVVGLSDPICAIYYHKTGDILRLKTPMDLVEHFDEFITFASIKYSKPIFSNTPEPPFIPSSFVSQICTDTTPDECENN